MHERFHSLISRVFGSDAVLAGDFGGNLELVVRGTTVAKAGTLESLVQRGQRAMSAAVAQGKQHGSGSVPGERRRVRRPQRYFQAILAEQRLHRGGG